MALRQTSVKMHRHHQHSPSWLEGGRGHQHHHHIPPHYELCNSTSLFFSVGASVKHCDTTEGLDTRELVSVYILTGKVLV